MPVPITEYFGFCAFNFRVWQYDDAGVGHEYYFRIDSLERILVDVPEPSVLLIFISGFLLILWGRKINYLRNNYFNSYLVH